MSHEVWIARDGDGMLSEFCMKPHWLTQHAAYDVDHGGFVTVLTRDTFPSIKPGECVRFVAAERFANGEPVQEGETIPVRIAVVANADGDWGADGWCKDGEIGSDAAMFAAAHCVDGDHVSRTIITARVPVPRVTEVQGVVEGTVTP